MADNKGGQETIGSTAAATSPEAMEPASLGQPNSQDTAPDPGQDGVIAEGLDQPETEAQQPDPEMEEYKRMMLDQNAEINTYGAGKTATDTAAKTESKPAEAAQTEAPKATESEAVATQAAPADIPPQTATVIPITPQQPVIPQMQAMSQQTETDPAWDYNAPVFQLPHVQAALTGNGEPTVPKYATDENVQLMAAANKLAENPEFAPLINKDLFATDPQKALDSIVDPGLAARIESIAMRNTQKATAAYNAQLADIAQARVIIGQQQTAYLETQKARLLGSDALKAFPEAAREQIAMAALHTAVHNAANVPIAKTVSDYIGVFNQSVQAFRQPQSAPVNRAALSEIERLKATAPITAKTSVPPPSKIAQAKVWDPSDMPTGAMAEAVARARRAGA